MRRDGELAEQPLQVLEELVITDAAARQVDRAHGQRAIALFVQALADDLEYTAHHPAVQRGHQAIALGGGNEAVREDDAAALVVQAQEDLDMPGAFMGSKGGNFLGIEAETVFFQGHVQALDPSHLAKAHGQLAVIGVIHLHAVAALLLGHVAGHVGGPQRGFEGGRPLGNMHQA
ncbi:hypothetical protein D9M71_392060 [compost metagenome]